KPLGQFLRQDARNDIGWAARRIWHDQLDRLRRISLRNGGALLRADAHNSQQYCCNPNDVHCGLPVAALRQSTPWPRQRGSQRQKYSRSGPCSAPKLARSCPLWVRSVELVPFATFPLYPLELT